MIRYVCLECGEGVTFDSNNINCLLCDWKKSPALFRMKLEDEKNGC